jgi:hypothetical protein
LLCPTTTPTTHRRSPESHPPHPPTSLAVPIHTLITILATHPFTTTTHTTLALLPLVAYVAYSLCPPITTTYRTYHHPPTTPP